jgi:hypothetical protein
MQVTMTKQWEVARELFLAGVTYEVDSVTGAAWIARGIAVAYTAPARKPLGPVFVTSTGKLVDGDGDEIAVTGSGGGAVESKVLADRPAAGPENIGVELDIVDVDGGTRQKSNGTSWIDVSPGVTKYDTVSALWADRGTGVLNQVKIFQIGNQPVPAIWDGSAWQPYTGRVLLTRLAAPILGTAGASSTATSADFTVPGGLMGLNGSLEIIWEGSASASPTSALPAVNFGGSTLTDGLTVGTKRNVRMRRIIRNQNAANSQVISENAGDLGGFGTGAGAVQTLTKNTANDQVINVGYTFTHATSIVATLHRFEVWWSA